MIWSHNPRQTAATLSEGGFTLIEMLVVVAIMAFALVLIVGFKPPWSRGFDLDTTAAELAGQLRLVRADAIAANRPAALQIDLARHLYRAGSAAPHALPAMLTIRLLTIAGLQRGDRAGAIRFNPDGSSTGGRIVLADGRRQIAIGVDWLTGRVGIADVR